MHAPPQGRQISLPKGAFPRVVSERKASTRPATKWYANNRRKLQMLTKHQKRHSNKGGKRTRISCYGTEKTSKRLREQSPASCRQTITQNCLPARKLSPRSEALASVAISPKTSTKGGGYLIAIATPWVKRSYIISENGGISRKATPASPIGTSASVPTTRENGPWFRQKKKQRGTECTL